MLHTKVDSCALVDGEGGKATQMIDSRLDVKRSIECTSQYADKTVAPTHTQIRWLGRGLDQPGGKLPLFDEDGAKISARTIRSCIGHGWAEPWFRNPLKPDWLVCRLTETGRAIVQQTQPNLKR